MLRKTNWLITPQIHLICFKQNDSFVIKWIITFFTQTVDVALKDMSTVQKESPNFIPGKNGVLNFQKWRQMAKIMQAFH